MAEADRPLSDDRCREPTVEDLAKLCGALNHEGAKYIVIGGFAIRAAGFSRLTMDIDLLVETTPENEAKVLKALLVLPDQVAREIKAGEVSEYGVVRLADEILVDLMKSGCGIDYAEAIKDAVWHDVGGVRIPFASPSVLWRMKQTHREKDIPDQLFLRKLFHSEGIELEPTARNKEGGAEALLPNWLRRLFSRRAKS